MRAAWYCNNGTAQDVLVVGQMPDPQAGAGEVRVRLICSGVNPSDVKSRMAKPVMYERLVPHSDGAGVIDQVGAGVAASRLGERVWTWNAQWNRAHGTAAEFVALPTEQAVHLPDGISFAAGACLGIPALTAVQAVRLSGQVAGKKVLITGASSAVGHYIAQLLAQAGALILGTVGSPEKAIHARAAGVQEVIYYKTEPVVERVKALTGGNGVDLIVDMDFSTTSTWLAAGVLAPHGSLVCYGSNAPEVQINFRSMLWNSLNLKFFLVYDLLPADRQEALRQLDDLLCADKLKHSLGREFALADIVQAHQTVEAGRDIGNIVLII